VGWLAAQIDDHGIGGLTPEPVQEVRTIGRVVDYLISGGPEVLDPLPGFSSVPVDQSHARHGTLPAHRCPVCTGLPCSFR